MVTRKGIYYDLSISPFHTVIGDYVFYFSSSKNRMRFNERYDEYWKAFTYSFEYHTKFKGAFVIAPALRLYSEIEKRGFRVEKPNGEIITDKSALIFEEVV